MGQEAENLIYLGRVSEARKVLDRCLAAAPTYVNATVCTGG